MNVLRMSRILVVCALLAACSQQVAGDKLVLSYEGVARLDLSGSWERDYSRGDSYRLIPAPIEFWESRNPKEILFASVI